MPYQINGRRNYKKEYLKYHGTAEQKRNRAERNKGRRIMTAAGKAKKGDGRDVGHIKAISKGGLSTVYNLQMQSKSENRSFSKTSNSKMKSERSKRESVKRTSNRRTGR
jgi:hypothetical protein